MMGRKAIEMLGKRFGRLVVRVEAGSGPGGVRYLCDCDCGNEHITTGNHLRHGTKSCGCHKRELAHKIGSKAAQWTTRHGHARVGAVSSAYSRWCGMISRCEDPKHKAFKNYGGRGITVCERWRNDFAAFLADMGEPPEGLTLDRINNDGNYEPGNCRWSTRVEQMANARPHAKGYKLKKRRDAKA